MRREKTNGMENGQGRRIRREKKIEEEGEYRKRIRENIKKN